MSSLLTSVLSTQTDLLCKYKYNIMSEFIYIDELFYYVLFLIFHICESLLYNEQMPSM